MTYQAILFDKDGTLFDFAATWNTWSAQVIKDLSEGDAALAQRIAETARFDLSAGRFLPDSPIIAGTNREAAERLASAVPHRDVDDIEQHLMISAAKAPLAPAVPLQPFCDALLARDLFIGVMTNDTEYGARSHLESAGVLDRFHFVAGFDSGYGAKPAPDPLLAFCSAVSVAPERAIMVGDSTHDLIAGRAAGMATLGVLTGMAETAELSPYANAVLPDIGHIPAWLDH